MQGKRHKHTQSTCMQRHNPVREKWLCWWAEDLMCSPVSFTSGKKRMEKKVTVFFSEEQETR